MKRKTNRQPMQPMEIAKDGYLRFKKNPIVHFMLDELERRGFDLNDIHMANTGANKHDWDQFNQLIGYSVSHCPIKDELTGYRVKHRMQLYIDKFLDPEKNKQDEREQTTDANFYNTSFVRKNIISDPNYTPYCGNIKCKTTPRTVFNGNQFVCPECKWYSQFEEEFIKKYRGDLK